MRFYSAWRRTGWVWTGLCVLQLITASLRLHGDYLQHRSTSVAVSMLVLWSLLLTVYVYTATHSSFIFGEDSLDWSEGFLRKKISYGTIVAVRIPRRAKSGRAVCGAVELEVAPLAPEIFPHTYMTVRLPEAKQFAEALHRRAPQAVYEPA